MEIKNFTESVRLGHDAYIDVVKIGTHCADGVMAVAYLFKSYNELAVHKVEVRKKGRDIALITYNYKDIKLPVYWQDAEILFSWEQEDT